MGKLVNSNYPLDDVRDANVAQLQRKEAYKIDDQKMPTITVSKGSNNARVKDITNYNNGTRGKFDEGYLNDSVADKNTNLHDQFVKLDITY